VLSLAILLLLSQVAAAEIRIGGRVLAPGGTPLPKAEILLLPMADPLVEARDLMEERAAEPIARALTGEHGRFELAAPRAGLFKVRVAAAGFVPSETSLRPLIEPTVLPDVELASDSGMRIKVTGPEGEAISGAMVLVKEDRPRYIFDANVWLSPMRAGRTAEDGGLLLPRGEKERISISVSADGYAFYEKRGLRGTSARISLQAGARRLIEVRSAEEKILPGVTAALGQQTHPVGRTDDAGRIVLYLPSSAGTGLDLLADDGRRLETQLQPADAEQSEAQRLTLPARLVISGRLIDAATRRALPGGVVWDQADPTVAAMTDSAGGYVLGGPAGSRLFITAGAPGYMPADAFEFQLNDDGRPGVTLALHPAAAIEGKVVDASGAGVAGAEVELEERKQPGMMRLQIGMQQGMPRTLSGERGAFRLSPLNPDKGYDIKVRAEGYAPAKLTVTGLEPYETRAGLAVTLTRGQAIRGIVVDEEGRPIREASVAATPATEMRGPHFMRIEEGGGTDQIASAADDDGAFVIEGLPAGKFDLEVKRSGYAKRQVPAIEIASGGEPVDVGEVTLQLGEKVQGIVLDRDGQPVEGADISIEASGPMMTFSMGGGPEREPDATSEAGGWFIVEDLSPDERYSLRFSRTGYVAKSVGPFELPRLEPLEVVLDTASRVIGHVLDNEGEPIPAARVNLERSQTIEIGGRAMAMMMMSGAVCDNEGRFEFEDQEPGRISLSAVASLYQEAKLDHLEVPKGEDLDGVVITLEAGAVVEGRILAPDGKPALGARVRPVGEEPEMIRMGGAGADGNGYYRLEGLEPGSISVEATHRDYPRVVKDIEAKEGINGLNLRFEGGQEVSGMVLSTGSEPIGEAAVRLVPAGRFWGGSEAVSEPDGSFKMPGVQEGDYRLRAEAEEFAPSGGDMQVQVGGEPVTGLEVRLDPGVTVYGKISGLSPLSFAQVGVRAEGSGYRGLEEASVDYQGGYRLEHLPAGNYSIVATLADSGRQAKEQVVLEQGALEARVDLQFGSGLTLSGLAFQGNQPLTGVTVITEGVDIENSGWSQTDDSGFFSIEGLDQGEYKVQVRDFSTGLAYEENVALATSREIRLEVPTARVGGRIVDSFDKQPLAGVTISLDDSGTAGRGLLPAHSTTTDLEGRFMLDSIADGNWRLSASKKGYAAVSQPIVVQHEQDVDNIRIVMEATEGLTLEARLHTGGSPDELMVAVVDPAGGALVSGHYTTGENGRVRLSSVPAGNWDLIVSAAGAATANLRAQAPGPVVPVSLLPACGLRIEVPALSEAGAIATVRLRTADGMPFRTLNWTAQPRSEWRMTGGMIELSSLPPGSWEVTITAADGRSWQGSAVTSAGAAASMLLE
jgi:uncharacterized GH25 family protein